MKAKTILILYLAVVSLGSFAILVPVIPSTVSVRCPAGALCPDLTSLVQLHGYGSLTYSVFGFGGVLMHQFGWFYSFRWSR